MYIRSFWIGTTLVPRLQKQEFFFTLSEGKFLVAIKNAPRVAEVQRDRRRPRRRSGRLPDADVRLLGHHVEVQDDVAVALLVAICNQKEMRL